MKKTVWLLVLCIILTTLSGCTLQIPSISEATDVIDAYVYYKQTGNLPQNIDKILCNVSGQNDNSGKDAVSQQIPLESPEETLKNTLVKTTKSDILALARQYYEFAYPQIESDTRSEYNRLISWQPDFSGKKEASSEEIELQKNSSISVSLALSYTSAKNFYLAMAASVFSINPEDPTAVGNFAAATAAYGDDLLLEGIAANVEKYYTDAKKIYHYALLLTKKDDKYSTDALPLLVSMGNLYLDSGKHNEAYACFKTALEINDEYSAAVEGLYNTYMALKQYKKALELIAETTKYPAFIGATAKVSKKRNEDFKKPGILDATIDEESLQVKLDSFNTIESISSADFLDDIDAEAKQKLSKLIRQVQDKMKYTAPDITLISQYANLKTISEPLGQSALEAFYEGVYQLSEKAYELEEKVYSRDISDEGLEEMEKYKISKNADPETVHKFYAAASKAFPEYSIYSLNPYDYANPVDIIVQRYNIENFIAKFNAYNMYIMQVNRRVERDIQDIMDIEENKENALWDEMYEKINKIDADGPEFNIEAHRIHNTYYPKINGVRQTYWNQATSIAVTAYQQKIKKYAEQMYNNCMKHVVLISDDTIQTNLEERLQAALLSGLVSIYEQLHLAFSFVVYDDDCGCSLEQLEADRKALEKERRRLENEQIKKNMEAKKRFESGELDENSEYYKNLIKKYEITINTPFVKGVIGPYKTILKVKFELPGITALDYEKVEHHIRNTTTYNGGIEIGSGGDVGIAKVGANAYLKFAATKGADGQFAVDDVDIIGGGKFTLGTAYTSSEAGMEASAVRGTKSYANFSVTADNLINEEFKSAMGNWAPNLKKEIWNGDYPLY